MKVFFDDTSKLSIEDMFACFQAIGKNGDIVLYKYDGKRLDAPFTVAILSGQDQFESIRIDDESLDRAVRQAAKKYFALKSQ